MRSCPIFQRCVWLYFSCIYNLAFVFCIYTLDVIWPWYFFKVTDINFRIARPALTSSFFWLIDCMCLFGLRKYHFLVFCYLTGLTFLLHLILSFVNIFISLRVLPSVRLSNIGSHFLFICEISANHTWRQNQIYQTNLKKVTEVGIWIFTFRMCVWHMSIKALTYLLT